MPPCDNLVQVCEGNRKAEGEAKEWWMKGVNLSIWLRSDIMERLIKDRGLRAFAKR